VKKIINIIAQLILPGRLLPAEDNLRDSIRKYQNDYTSAYTIEKSYTELAWAYNEDGRLADALSLYKDARDEFPKLVNAWPAGFAGPALHFQWIFDNGCGGNGWERYFDWR
jgi:hypothetical protein